MNKNNSGDIISPMKNNASKGAEHETLLESRRSDLLDSSINTICLLIKDEIDTNWTDSEKFSLFEKMPTELLDEFDDELIKVKNKWLNRYYTFLSQKNN